MNEVESCQTLINTLRVPQLQAVLQTFDPSRSGGRKHELITRIQNFLRDKKTQTQVCQRIREVTRTPPFQPPTGGQSNMRNMYPYQPRPTYYPIRPNQPFATPFMQNTMGSMGSNVPVVLPSRVGGKAEKMSILRLPFYDVHMVVLKLSELQALNGRTGDCRCVFPFSLTPEITSLLTYRGDQPTPRYELQLRMFLFDCDIEQSDDFPPNCVIRVDDNPVALPPIIPTNKPNAEQKRYSRPVDITQYVQSQRNGRNHKVEIDWFSDRRTWAVGIWLVFRQNSHILLTRMLDNGVRRTVDETKKRIAAMLDGDDDNIALDQLKISLLCPLMKTRMKIPARTKNCGHLQCFDLLNFLDMNEKRPSWKCPQCNANAHYDNLILDQYFMDLLKAVEKNVEEVELLRDGNWKILEVACDTLSDDDDDDSPKKPIKPESSAAATTSAKPKKDDAEIITLDDSDDEDSTPPPQSSRAPLTTNGINIQSKSPSRAPAAKQARRDHSESSSSSSESPVSSDASDHQPRRRKIPAPAKRPPPVINDSEIIVLDSSDDEDVPQPAAVSSRNGTASTNGNSSRSHSSDDVPPPSRSVSNGNVASTNASDRPPRRNGVNSNIASRSNNQK